MLTLNEFAVRNTFHRCKDEDGNPVYWVVDSDDSGYILVWPNGESHHTYHWPPNTFTPWPWDDEG